MQGTLDDDNDPSTPCVVAENAALRASVALDIAIDTFDTEEREIFEEEFISDMAMAVGVSPDRIVVLGIEGGSVSVTFEIRPSTDGQALPENVLLRAFENPIELAGATVQELGEIATVVLGACTQNCTAGYVDSDCDIQTPCAPCVPGALLSVFVYAFVA